MKSLIAGLAGLLLGGGLAMAGLLEPSAILRALDPFGAFDPRLYIALTFGTATFGVVRWFARRRGAPGFDCQFHDPTSTVIDRQLVLGALLFGVAWGLSGFCPALAVGNLGAGGWQALVFLAALVVGMRASGGLTLGGGASLDASHLSTAKSPSRRPMPDCEVVRRQPPEFCLGAPAADPINLDWIGGRNGRT